MRSTDTDLCHCSCSRKRKIASLYNSSVCFDVTTPVIVLSTYMLSEIFLAAGVSVFAQMVLDCFSQRGLARYHSKWDSGKSQYLYIVFQGGFCGIL